MTLLQEVAPYIAPVITVAGAATAAFGASFYGVQVGVAVLAAKVDQNTKDIDSVKRATGQNGEGPRGAAFVTVGVCEAVHASTKAQVDGIQHEIERVRADVSEIRSILLSRG